MNNDTKKTTTTQDSTLSHVEKVNQYFAQKEGKGEETSLDVQKKILSHLRWFKKATIVIIFILAVIAVVVPIIIAFTAGNI